MKLQHEDLGARRSLAGLAMVATLGATTVAAASPTSIPYAGLLTATSGQAIEGPVAVEVAVYSASSGGSLLWGPAPIPNVSAADGLLRFAVGAAGQPPLDDSIMAAGPLWLELRVDTHLMSPRQEVSAAPYAVGAGNTAALAGEQAADFAPIADLADVALSGAYGDLGGTPSLATVATSGAYAGVAGSPSLSNYALASNVASTALAAVEGASSLSLAGPVTFGGEVEGLRFESASSPPVACDSSSAGKAYWNVALGLQICDGTEWGSATGGSPAGSGGGTATAGTSCASILAADSAAESGPYWLADTTGGSPYPVYCDMDTESGGWTHLMTAAGTAMDYDSPLWTDARTINDGRAGLTGDLAKFRSFSQRPVTELLLISASGDYTRLQLPSAQTLQQLFQGPATSLTVVAGRGTPGELINGKSWSYCGSPWRTNSQGSYQARIRLGGWVSNVWNCTYGNDGTGQATGAHLLGFGLTDLEWSPFNTNRVSFGIRDAHDENYLAPGQARSYAHILGR